MYWSVFFFFQAEDGIRDGTVTGVQTCALPIFVCLALDFVRVDCLSVSTRFDSSWLQEKLTMTLPMDNSLMLQRVAKAMPRSAATTRSRPAETYHSRQAT